MNPIEKIDNALTDFSKRDLLSSNEVCDLLLDLRLMLFMIDAETREHVAVLS